MTRPLLVVSCSAGKAEHAAPPRRLYTGSYTSAALAAADAVAGGGQTDVRILSAAHGLLDPDGPPVAPYDVTLPARAPEGGWAGWWDVRAGRAILEAAACVWVLAGRRYLAAVHAVRPDARRPAALDAARGIGDHLALFAAVRRADDPAAVLSRGVRRG